MGGWDGSASSSRVDLLSLDPDNHPVPECLKSLGDAPFSDHGASAGVNSGKS